MSRGTGVSRRGDGAVSVEVRFYARYAELAGTNAMTVAVPAPATVGSLVGLVREVLPSASILPERPMVAVNEQHALPDHSLADGDVVAFLPPLAGG